MNDNYLLEKAIHAAYAAGREILKVYGENFTVEMKADQSPLTLADRMAHRAVSDVLASTGLPVLSEEGKDIPYPIRNKWRRYWLVDPLDGTKEFVKRNGEFTVNIALIEAGKPVMGVILVPVTGILFFASGPAGAFKCVLKGESVPGLDKLISESTILPLNQSRTGFSIVSSRSHHSEETAAYIERISNTHPEPDFVSIGSSLKLCLVAEGAADLYPRFGPTMEWDTAAGHALVEISGGYVFQAGTNIPLAYNKENLLNPYFIAGRP